MDLIQTWWPVFSLFSILKGTSKINALEIINRKLRLSATTKENPQFIDLFPELSIQSIYKVFKMSSNVSEKVLNGRSNDLAFNGPYVFFWNILKIFKNGMLCLQADKGFSVSYCSHCISCLIPCSFFPFITRFIHFFSVCFNLCYNQVIIQTIDKSYKKNQLTFQNCVVGKMMNAGHGKFASICNNVIFITIGHK